MQAGGLELTQETTLKDTRPLTLPILYHLGHQGLCVSTRFFMSDSLQPHGL